MRRGGRILVLLGLFLGAITALVALLTLSSAQATTPQVATRPVVVAMQNIPGRVEIPPEALGVQDWPANVAPPTAFERIDLVSGKMTMDPIYQGQIVLPQMIIDKSKIKETRSNASFVVPKGKIAVAFPLTPLSSIAAALQDGDYVDILLTLSPGQAPVTQTRVIVTSVSGTEGLPQSQLMLQDVLVLHIGNWSTVGQEKAAGPSNILTFALTWQDALALKAAREQGTIELVLRGAGDHTAVTTEPANLEYLNKRFKFNLAPSIGR